jgi:transcriptional regulator with XRE-family HTH domain
MSAMQTVHRPRRKPTLEQVARYAGVSRATVSRVVNGSTTVDPAIREVVQQAVEDLNYVPNLAARALMTSSSTTPPPVRSSASARTPSRS